MQRFYLFILAITLLGVPLSSAQSIVLDKEEDRAFSEFNWIPYVFSSESFGLGVGVGGAYTGWPSEPSSIMGAVTLGTKGSYNFAGLLSDWQVPGVPRLVIEPFVMFGLYRDQRIYAGRNSAFPGERSGSSNSHKDNFQEATQWDNRMELKFHYLLPVGHGREQIVHKYSIDRGLLLRNPSGGNAWNPLTSGRTRFSVTPVWRGQTLQDDQDRELPIETFNVELALEYENHDFPFNPTAGSSQRIAYQKDFTGDERFGGWDAWTFEADKVFNPGPSDHFRQRVLALNLWTSYSPSWETRTVDGVETVTHRPPYYEGPRLGGLYRMRAYDDNRWQDKAAMYYSAEVRLIPEWQPLNEIELLDWAAIQYWQWVAFVEAGQVASNYNLSDLHSGMKTDVGIGLRGMVHKAVVRLDFSVGEEGSRITAMYGHPF